MCTSILDMHQGIKQHRFACNRAGLASCHPFARDQAGDMIMMS